MNVEPVPAAPAAPASAPPSPEARRIWVDARLIGVLLEHTKAGMLPVTVMMPVLFALFWQHVNTTALIVWTVLLLAVKVLRHHMVNTYQERYQHADDLQQLAFIKRYGWTWMAVGVLAGGGVGLACTMVSGPVQFLSGMVLLGQGVLAVSIFSAYLPVANRFIDALMASMAIGLLVPVLLGMVPMADPREVVTLALLLGVLWWLFRMGAQRVGQIHRASFDLQYSNQDLINSLMAQTRALERAVSTKNRFLASAAHDLRQPVHALSLYAEWLTGEPDMVHDIAPRIQQSTRAINELFDSLFDLTRIDAGNYKVRMQHVDVQQLLDEVALQFEPVASGKELKLRTHTRPTTLWADPVMLRRILGNLVSNALRHTYQGGVLVGLRHRSDRLVFEVWDTGVGIAPEHQEAIFQEFFRVSQHQGTEDSLGLGLTIVSRLAHLMAYQLSLHSVPGKGSVFRVSMPFKDQVAEDGHGASPST